jgi:hypothetical protein
MASDPRFLEAWVNRCDHRVLGHRLHPLCLLDMLTLDAIDSPFIADGAVANESDFLLAVLLLSRPHKSLEVNADLPVPTLRDRLRLRFCDMARENAALKAYFDDYYSTLEMWRPDTGDKKCQAPWILGTAAFLLSQTNLSEWRIWTAPIGQMLCYANSLEEQLGGSQVVSMEELAEMEERRNG